MFFHCHFCQQTEKITIYFFKYQPYIVPKWKEPGTGDNLLL